MLEESLAEGDVVELEHSLEQLTGGIRLASDPQPGWVRTHQLIFLGCPLNHLESMSGVGSLYAV